MAHDEGRLTEEGIAHLRRRIGIPRARPTPPHNYEVTWDGVRHFAYGYGDDNPLWCDPEYGPRTRWGTLIAPPTFLYTMGEPDAPPMDPETRELMRGDPLAGLGSYQASMEFEWWRPLELGDRCAVREALVGVDVREGRFAGRMVAETYAFVFWTRTGALHAIQRGTWFRAERHASRDRAETRQYRLPEPYTTEELERIERMAAEEERRGAVPRYFEDVEVGEQLPTLVRGPLRVTDIIIWHIGWGMQLTPPGAFRLSDRVRRKVPGLFTPNELNIPDTVQRLHWDAERAQELGIPRPYDYGALRETFLVNLCTNWMGDEGWLWKLRCEHRRFVFIGDTYFVTGEVADKRVTEVGHEVHLELRVENQHGETVTPAQAVVLLPTRAEPVRLPAPPASDASGVLAHEVTRLADPSRRS